MQTHNLQYTSYIGDGDSKAYLAVSAMKPYGDDVPTQKDESIGHVHKRVGKNLRDLKQRLGCQKLSDGKPIGGRNRLTGARIDSLQHYYGEAVKKHAGNIDDMERAIKASLYHSLSVDDDYCHEFCPSGIKSWCGWQKAKAGGKPYQHHDPLPIAVFEEVKHIYVRLTDKALLLRCARSATQNANESLNGIIWSLCPKETFCGKQTVDTAVNLAVVLYNDDIRN